MNAQADFTKEELRLMELTRDELFKAFKKVIYKLPTITGCHMADNKKMHMIQREELLEKLNKKKENN